MERVRVLLPSGEKKGGIHKGSYILNGVERVIVKLDKGGTIVVNGKRVEREEDVDLERLLLSLLIAGGLGGVMICLYYLSFFVVSILKLLLAR